MIHHLMLRWLVTGLFAISAAESGLAIFSKRRPWTLAVSNGLHFVMGVAMAAMAWPWGAQLPATGLAVFFLLAAVWFATMAIVAARETAVRVLHGYHGLMMLATAWMYAGMDMAAMNMPAGNGSLTWFGVVNWFGTVGFAVAAVFWTYQYFLEWSNDAARHWSLGKLDQAMMAAGMAILFGAMLFRI